MSYSSSKFTRVRDWTDIWRILFRPHNLHISIKLHSVGNVYAICYIPDPGKTNSLLCFSRFVRIVYYQKTEYLITIILIILSNCKGLSTIEHMKKKCLQLNVYYMVAERSEMSATCHWTFQKGEFNVSSKITCW